MSEDLENFLPRIYRFSLRLARNRHEAEDLTHDTVVKALQSWGQLRDTAARLSWLLRITTNLWKDRGKRRTAQSLNEPEVVDHRSAPELRLEFAEEVTTALQQLDELPERQRAVLYLCAVEGLNATEISTVLDITAQNVRVHLHHARMAMNQWNES